MVQQGVKSKVRCQCRAATEVQRHRSCLMDITSGLRNFSSCRPPSCQLLAFHATITKIFHACYWFSDNDEVTCCEENQQHSQYRVSSCIKR